MYSSAQLNEQQAITLLKTIAHPVRMSAFRFLAAAGFAGLSAREMAEKLGTSVAAISSHLALLAKINLLDTDKTVTPTRYIANVKLLRALAAYLGDQCVGAR